MKHRSTLRRTSAILTASAAAMGVMALYNIYRARKTELESPPQGKFVTVDGVRLHYLELGEGPPIVLLHGNVVTAEDFALSGVFELAAARHRVIAFDRPGFGYSDRPRGSAWAPAAQAELLRHAFSILRIERPVVLGHSWGAVVAVTLALNYPGVIRGLVLLSGYYQPTLRTDALLSLPGAIPVVGDVMRYTVSPLIGKAMLPLMIKGMFAPRQVPHSFAEGFSTELSLRPAQIRAESQDGTTMVPAAEELKDRYLELSIPVVIMAGTKDRVVNVDRHSVWLHDQIPNSTLRLIPGAGHMLHYEVPEQVVDAIAAAGGNSKTTAQYPSAA